jgi:molybdate transport system substrate-binding protein
MLHVLSAGAAKAVVTAAARDAGVELGGAFGAVGAMQDKLLAGEPCDVIVLTRSMIDALAASGRVDPATEADLGRVCTGIAVKRGAPAPNIARATGLSVALLGAEEIYVPDLVKSTAGKHIARLLETLGIAAEVAPRLKEFPNGAAAMKAMAESPGLYSIGCTQASEILYTEGVILVGPLPGEFELVTLYSAAVCSTAADVPAAQAFVRHLTGELTRRVREKAGFEEA